MHDPQESGAICTWLRVLFPSLRCVYTPVEKHAAFLRSNFHQASVGIAQALLVLTSQFTFVATKRHYIGFA